MSEPQGLDIRPHQLMCTVCKLAASPGDEYCHMDRLDEIHNAARAEPWTPVTLRCNASSLYSYQNPGLEYDTPEGKLFNKRRDLTILQKLGLVPGDTRPAFELFSRLYAKIDSTRGICRFPNTTSDEWQSCPLAQSGNYERAHAEGRVGLIRDRRSDDKKESKSTSCAEIYGADELHIRPHHLMCMTCFQGGKDELGPIEEDNLFEAIDVIQKNPDIPIKLIAGCCIICPPCSKYDPDTGLCISANAMALRDEKKDLDTLQLLGLKYNDVLPACDLLSLLYDRVENTTQVCGYGDGEPCGYEWTVCGGPDGSPSYIKGRAAGMGVDRVKRRGYTPL